MEKSKFKELNIEELSSVSGGVQTAEDLSYKYSVGESVSFNVRYAATIKERGYSFGSGSYASKKYALYNLDIPDSPMFSGWYKEDQFSPLGRVPESEVFEVEK